MARKKKKTVDLGLKGPIQDRDVKVKITAWMDMDVKRALQKEAEKQGVGYQTLMNSVLRKQMLTEDPMVQVLNKLEQVTEKLHKLDLKVRKL